MTVHDPDLRRSVVSSTFKDASLFGLEASGTTVLFGKAALRLPVAISENSGGRRSIHDMPQDQPTLTAVYIVDLQIVRELLTRTGDSSYAVELASRDGQTLFEGMGDLEEINPGVGHSRIVFRGSYKEWAPTLVGLEADLPAQWMRISIFWSALSW
ncbi:hypothetical protein [Streptomyces sp. NRRL S-237]|uniref:hypothetical protein n=1 Tax=Streptomyces sp. NRRL S-237 TaxID=1463895 RepID=UPI00131BD887|nr:hypothetical protein [Streptomyces sp. NRRL S-237]